MEDKTQKTVDEICKIILSESIEQQNEIFGKVRAAIVKERLNHIEREKERINAHGREIDYAENSMREVFLSSYEINVAKKARPME